MGFEMSPRKIGKQKVKAQVERNKRIETGEKSVDLEGNVDIGRGGNSLEAASRVNE